MNRVSRSAAKLRFTLSRRALLIIVLALGGCALVVWNGLVNVARHVNPAFVERIAPMDAAALARLGDRALLGSVSPRTTAIAQGYAVRAIARDPTIAMAYRVLGFAREPSRGRGEARALMLTSQALSRRDLAAQLWLIEDAVRRDDAPGALQHFDIALRTNKTAPSILFPILTNAAADPGLRAPIAELLAKRPAWRDRFLAFAIDNTDTIAPYAALADELSRRGAPLDHDRQLALTRRLVEQEQFEIAANRLRNAYGAKANALLTQRQTSHFGLEKDRYPFSWVVADDPGVAVSKNGDNGGLRFDIEAAWNGEMLKRLVMSPPGSYSLIASSTPGLYVTLTCAQKPNVQLGMMELDGGRAERRIQVPANCPAQWLIVGVRANTSDQPTQGRIDGLALLPE